MSLLFVCVRVAGRPVSTYTKGPPKDWYPIAPGYRAGIYTVATNKRDGHKFIKLVGDILVPGMNRKSFRHRWTAIKHAKSVCDANKDQYLYMEGIKNNIKFSDLRSPDELLVLLDFYEAIA